MKRLLSIIAIAFVVTGMFYLSSCTDDETTPSNQKPAINFLVEEGYISDDATLPVGADFKIKVFAQENGTSGANLESMKITRIFNLNAWDTTLTFNQSNYTLDAAFTAQAVPGNERIEFEVTDKDNQSAMVSLVITTEEIITGDPVSERPNIILGSWNDLDFGSFYSVALDSVMFKTVAGQNQAQVDFGFYKGTVNGNTIAAPANAQLQSVFALTWTTYNDTKIAMSALTAAEFDAIGTTYEFPEVTATTNSMNNLTVGNVLVFKTVAGKVGFIKIDAIPAMRGDKLQIDIKVQQ